MVGTLLRLKWKLFWRAPGKGAGRIIGQVLVGLYLVAALAVGWVALYLLRDSSLALRGSSVTLAFAVITLLWPLLTLMVAGADPTLDPGRFALFPVRAHELMPGLLLIGMLGAGGIFTVLLCLGFLVCWATSPSTAIAALAAILLGAPTCVLLARALTSWFTGALNSRRYRDAAAIVLALVGMCSGVGVQAVSRFVTSHGSSQGLQTAATIASWTPFGWAWALPWDAGRGNWPAFAARLVLAGALLGALWTAWRRALERALVSPLESGGGGGHAKAHSVVDRLVPAGPVGAVAARSLRYWRRDPRHLVQLVGMLLLPVLILAPQVINPVEGGHASLGGNLWVPVFTIVMMSSLVSAQETSYDGSALWMHVSSGITGREDRLGRVVGLAWITVPIAVLLSLVFSAMAGEWGSLPRLLGTCLAALGCSVAVGCVTGAWWQIPTPPPGQGAFARSSGGGVESLLMTFVSLLAAGIVLLPVAVAGMMAGSRPWLGFLVLVLGPLYGLAAVWTGVRWGGRILERRWPEILAKVSAKQ